ncbi:MAG: hypothetical protein GYB67_02585 [Chloroflexi bacterium]|nr:hypothetical protein [Chloroflexota bacterium]
MFNDYHLHQGKRITLRELTDEVEVVTEGGDPQVSGSEPLAPNLTIQNFAHYVELTAYSQRSALEPLLTERKG